MLCKTGYDVKVGYKSVDMLVCGNEGQWLPTGYLPLPDCSSKSILVLITYIVIIYVISNFILIFLV